MQYFSVSMHYCVTSSSKPHTGKKAISHHLFHSHYNIQIHSRWYTRSVVLVLIAVWWSTYHGVKTFPFDNNLKYLYLFPITQNGTKNSSICLLEAYNPGEELLIICIRFATLTSNCSPVPEIFQQQSLSAFLSSIPQHSNVSDTNFANRHDEHKRVPRPCCCVCPWLVVG